MNQVCKCNSRCPKTNEYSSTGSFKLGKLRVLKLLLTPIASL